MAIPHGYTESAGINSGGGGHTPDDDLITGRTEQPDANGGSRKRDDPGYSQAFGDDTDIPADPENGGIYDGPRGNKTDEGDWNKMPDAPAPREKMPNATTGHINASGDVQVEPHELRPLDKQGYEYQDTQKVWADGPLVKV